MKELIQKTREYLDYIEEHYDNVQKAWALLQDKCRDFDFVSDEQLFAVIDEKIKHHDESKLSAEEFTQYRQKFYPTSYETKNKKLFDRAWEHHKRYNDHHWQNWALNSRQRGLVCCSQQRIPTELLL